MRPSADPQSCTARRALRAWRNGAALPTRAAHHADACAGESTPRSRQAPGRRRLSGAMGDPEFTKVPSERWRKRGRRVRMPV
jgi:hypothetical protein